MNETYAKLHALRLSFHVEPLEVVKLVHDYRMYWKPKTVKTLLLAESHVYTEIKATNHKHEFKELPNYPCRYVRFVYCLSYGENHRLNKIFDIRKGTPQFWKLFNESVKGNFKIANNHNRADKIKHKIMLLNKMKDDGVWLLDASIIGLYNNGLKPDYTEYTKIVECSFESYCAPIINDIKPGRIIVIGKTVYDRIAAIINKRYPSSEWIHQPNARLKNEDKRTLSDI
ncbi:MAG: hypothetical protein M0042_11120 [Nitrospiraceae bacterium]|nr:hypothetical protein [Nitrospiraceae bacterium]